MFPIICKVGPFTIYSYGLALVVAFCVAAFLLVRQAKAYGISPDLMLNLSFIALASGIIGARLFYVILNLKFYLNNPFEIIMLSHGGLVWFGGLILGSASCIVYLRMNGLDVYRVMDLVIPYVALAQAIGRIGCLLNGCCFGRETHFFGLYFPAHDAILIPTQFYSSLALLGIYLILRIRQEQIFSERRLKNQNNKAAAGQAAIGAGRKGELFFVYLFLYSLWRFVIEFFRADSEVFIFGLSIFQQISIALFVLSVVMLVRIRKVNSSK